MLAAIDVQIPARPCFNWAQLRPDPMIHGGAPVPAISGFEDLRELGGCFIHQLQGVPRLHGKDLHLRRLLQVVQVFLGGWTGLPTCHPSF